MWEDDFITIVECNRKDCGYAEEETNSFRVHRTNEELAT